MSDIGIIESLTRRVEELELNWMLRHDGTVAPPFVQKLDERISKLEGAATKPAVVSINDPDAGYFTDNRRNCTRYEIPAHFNVRWSGEGSGMTMMAFNPEASPSGIPFEVALMYAKHGRKVMMADDPHQDVFEVRDGRFMGSHRHSVVSIQEVMSNAWYVLPKEEKP